MPSSNLALNAAHLLSKSAVADMTSFDFSLVACSRSIVPRSDSRVFSMSAETSAHCLLDSRDAAIVASAGIGAAIEVTWCPVSVAILKLSTSVHSMSSSCVEECV